MGARERREEVVEGILVRDVDDTQANAEFRFCPVWSRLSTPIPRSKRFREAIRGGLFTSSSVPGAGSARRVAPRFDEQLVIGAVKGRELTAAEDPRGGLLIGVKPQEGGGIGEGTRNQTGIVPPDEASPEPNDLLKMYCTFVVELNF